MIVYETLKHFVFSTSVLRNQRLADLSHLINICLPSNLTLATMRKLTGKCGRSAAQQWRAIPTRMTRTSWSRFYIEESRSTACDRKPWLLQSRFATNVSNIAHFFLPTWSLCFVNTTAPFGSPPVVVLVP